MRLPYAALLLGALACGSGGNRHPCSVASDCRTFSNYCGGCACDVLGTGDANPGCDAGTVSCVVDPCYGHTAACDATHHCVLQ